MVEAGVRFVTVNGWTGQVPHDTAGPPSSSWDMHGGNMGMGDAFGNGSYGMGFCLPRLDQALSALLSPQGCGMMDNTLVGGDGRIGRTPNVLTQMPPGRQHWPSCFSSIMAGAGIAGGGLYGKSDRNGGVRHEQPCAPRGIRGDHLPRPRHSHQRTRKATAAFRPDDGKTGVGVVRVKALHLASIPCRAVRRASARFLNELGHIRSCSLERQ